MTDSRTTSIHGVDDAFTGPQAGPYAQAWAELTASELTYRRLFQAAPDGILIIEAQSGRILNANASAEEVLDRPPGTLAGQSLWQAGLMPGAAETRAFLDELRASGSRASSDHLSVETRTGGWREVELVSSVYFAGPQQVIQCNVRDVTVRRRAELELEAQTTALTDQGRHKDEVLAMVSHELRNPLATIMSAARQLRDQPSQTTIQQQSLELIATQATQLSLLTNDLLDVSRLAAGHVVLHPELILLGDAIERATNAVRPAVEARHHELIIASNADTPLWVRVDLVRFEQVLTNLLLNAAKYTAEGGRIRIDAEPEGDEAVVRVRDNGIGIAADVLPHIFNMFTQAEQSADRTAGLGIGLALAKQLTELHGGTVEVKSTLGEGTKFTVRIPIAAPPAVATSATTAARESPLRVLVIEDNVELAHLWQTMLSDEGHDLRTARDGPTGVDIARSFRPDVAIVDLGLPGWDGIEVAQRLRSESALAGLVLIAMTGYDREADRTRAARAGFDHYVLKPPDFDAVIEQLKTLSHVSTLQMHSTHVFGARSLLE